MPDAQDYFVIAIGSIAVFAVVMVVAIGAVWRALTTVERVLATVFLLLSSGIIVYWLLLYKTQPIRLHRREWMLLWCCAGSSVAYFVTRAIAYAFERRQGAHHRPDRRAFIERSVTAAAGIVIATPFATYDPADVIVERHSITLPHLPLSADGVTMAILSDIHAGAFIEPKHVALYVHTIMHAKPDVILLPGDFITAFADELTQYISTLAQLSAPLGTYAVLGNHDYFNGAAPILHRMLAQAGIQLLDDEVVEICGIELFGISDRRRTAIERAAQKEMVVPIANRLSQSACPLVMVHRPFIFDALAMLNPRVITIAGHTHGGQVAIELRGSEPVAINRLFTRYIRGWYRSGSAVMYITRGVGTIGLPIRIGAPPEITLITLRRT